METLKSEKYFAVWLNVQPIYTCGDFNNHEPPANPDHGPNPQSNKTPTAKAAMYKDVKMMVEFEIIPVVVPLNLWMYREGWGSRDEQGPE